MRRVVLTEGTPTIAVPRMDARLVASSQEAARAGSAMVVGKLVPSFAGASYEEMCFDEFKGGITNKLICVSLAKDSSRRCLVRIYGASTEYLIDRNQELVVLQQSPVTPRLYGTFLNGYVYEYTPGRILQLAEIREPAMIRLTAEAVARLHSSEVPGISKKPRLFAVFDQWFNNVPATYTDPQKQALFAKSVHLAGLRREVDWLRSEIEGRGCAVSFCHNDLLLPNILYDAGSQKVNFIDWEYSAYSYAAHDIANHFCEWAGFECQWELYPTDEQQRTFLRHYLRSLRPDADYAVPEEEVDDWMQSVQLCELTAHLFWGIWALIQAEISSIDFDYLDYALRRFGRFRDRKAVLLERSLPHARL